MKFVVKIFPEIMIKSPSVRKRFTKMLQGNLRNVLQAIDPQVKVSNYYDALRVSSELDTAEGRDAFVQALTSTPGVQQILEVIERRYDDLHHIYEQTRELVAAQIAGKSFRVRCRRRGSQDFTSLDVERYVGGGLLHNTDALAVKLKDPQVEVQLEIEGELLFVVAHKHQGIGGFPIATQESVLSLISGGFDSGVASFEFIRRGCRTHYCFFNLGGSAHEAGVKQMAYQLWRRFGFSHRVKFFSVPFEGVVAEILQKVEPGSMGVVLKRMMMRAADRIAEEGSIPALVTGEAVGQVSSQTLTNLALIDKAAERLILRPLITTSKQQIIDMARWIGTAELAESMPEYCGVISLKPNIAVKQETLLREEAKMDMAVLDAALANTKMEDIRDLADVKLPPKICSACQLMQDDDVIIDVRSVEEAEAKPFSDLRHQVLHIPFFKLATAFAGLDQNKTYWLYCERGVMSNLQALHLQEQGYNNVAVLTR